MQQFLCEQVKILFDLDIFPNFTSTIKRIPILISVSPEIIRKEMVF